MGDEHARGRLAILRDVVSGLFGTGAPVRAARREPPAVAVDWREGMRARVVVFAAVIAVWTVGIEARLLYLQVVQQDVLQSLADRQQLRTVKISPKRGEIFDRNGRLLAYSVEADTIAVDPSDVDNPEAFVRDVCRALGTCDQAQRRDILERLRKKGQFAYIARKVAPDIAQRVRALDLPGVAFYPESKRYYPKKELAAHVLGYVGLDNVGLGGLESTYDSRVRGTEGKVLVQADAKRRAVAMREERPATAGESLELTIDQYLQHIAERELRAGVDQSDAVAGTAIIMQPRTGEILALANYPTFNPNVFRSAPSEVRRNRAVQEVYEPGSTFKVVTASAAIEEEVIEPDDPIDCAPGFITFPGRPPIRDTHTYGVLSFTDVIVKSSNVGAIKAGLKLGPERLGRYVSRFGFGQTLAPDFRGESAGKVWSPETLDASALASVSMGYQVSVTPLQMATAVSAVANGGTLFEPRIIRAFIRDGRRDAVAPNTLRRAITPGTAATLTAIMEAVVERGTAKTAQVPGYTVAGKTGTARKIVNGRYSTSEYNASFVGFAPSRDPELVIVVVIDTPRRGGYYGGVAAAPVFQRIAEASLRHLGVPATIDASPAVLVARQSDDAEAAPLAVRANEGLAHIAMAADAGIMPDLRGLSMREAVRALAGIGLTPRLKGTGFVLEQAPEAGAPIVRADVLLTLGRRAAPATGGTDQ